MPTRRRRGGLGALFLFERALAIPGAQLVNIAAAPTSWKQKEVTGACWCHCWPWPCLDKAAPFPSQAPSSPATVTPIEQHVVAVVPCTNNLKLEQNLSGAAPLVLKCPVPSFPLRSVNPTGNLAAGNPQCTYEAATQANPDPARVTLPPKNQICQMCTKNTQQMVEQMVELARKSRTILEDAQSPPPTDPPRNQCFPPELQHMPIRRARAPQRTAPQP
jgi:hypothetical protein